MLIFAIDPGSTQSGVVVWDDETGAFLKRAKLHNEEVIGLIETVEAKNCHFVIEQITLYQRADMNVHDTILWYGRFTQVIEGRGKTPVFITRSGVKKQLLPGNRSIDRKDSTVSSYLKDRFAPGTSNHGKGSKTKPGYFYGFRADIWQAFALAVAFSDQTQDEPIAV